MDLEAAQKLVVPFIITQGLEGDAYFLRVIDREWCAIQKLADVDLPTSIDDIKKHNIAKFIAKLFIIKDICLTTNTLLTIKCRTKRSLHRYNQKKAVKMNSFFKKEVWMDPYEHESSDSEEEI